MKYDIGYSLEKEVYWIGYNVLNQLYSKSISQTNIISTVKTHIQHIINNKKHHYCHYFSHAFWGLNERTDVGVNETERNHLLRASNWLPTVVPDLLEVVGVGLDAEIKINTVIICIPLHLACPQLYIVPEKRYLFIKWNTRGQVMGADVINVENLGRVDQWGGGSKDNRINKNNKSNNTTPTTPTKKMVPQHAVCVSLNWVNQHGSLKNKD